MSSDLWNRWLALWTRAGGEAPRARFPHERLVVRYSESHRAYHTIAHIRHCLAEFDGARRLAVDPDAIEFAIWYHDAVYDPKASDNERQSADLARVALDVGGFPEDFTSRVMGLVLQTGHGDEPPDYDAKLLVDVDLAILGASERDFDEYERQVRKEYSWVPADVFALKRADILEAFLDRATVYRTMEFHGKYESAARRNLERSIDRLRAGVIIE